MLALLFLSLALLLCGHFDDVGPRQGGDLNCHSICLRSNTFNFDAGLCVTVSHKSSNALVRNYLLVARNYLLRPARLVLHVMRLHLIRLHLSTTCVCLLLNGCRVRYAAGPHIPSIVPPRITLPATRTVSGPTVCVLSAPTSNARCSARVLLSTLTTITQSVEEK